MRYGITDAVALEKRSRKMKLAQVAEKMLLSYGVARKRILDPKTMKLEDFFRLGKMFGWTDAEMSDLLISTYHDLREKRKI